MHRPDQPTSDISPFVNSDKTGFLHFKQNGTISSLNGKPLKLVVEFTFLVINSLSTLSDVNMLLGKALSATGRLLIVRKFSSLASTTVWMHHRHINESLGEKAR